MKKSHAGQGTFLMVRCPVVCAVFLFDRELVYRLGRQWSRFSGGGLLGLVEADRLGVVSFDGCVLFVA